MRKTQRFVSVRVRSFSYSPRIPFNPSACLVKIRCTIIGVRGEDRIVRRPDMSGEWLLSRGVLSLQSLQS